MWLPMKLGTKECFQNPQSYQILLCSLLQKFLRSFKFWFVCKDNSDLLTSEGVWSKVVKFAGKNSTCWKFVIPRDPYLEKPSSRGLLPNPSFCFSVACFLCDVTLASLWHLSAQRVKKFSISQLTICCAMWGAVRINFSRWNSSFVSRILIRCEKRS